MPSGSFYSVNKALGTQVPIRIIIADGPMSAGVGLCPGPATFSRAGALLSDRTVNLSTESGYVVGGVLNGRRPIVYRSESNTTGTISGVPKAQAGRA